MDIAIVISVVSIVVTVILVIGGGFLSWRLTTAKVEAAANANKERLAELQGHLDAERAKNDQRVDELHRRINDVRESFVRREDFREHMGKVEKTLDAIAASQIAMQKTFTDLLIEMRTGHPAE